MGGPRTELTEVSGIGIKFEPSHAEVFGAYGIIEAFPMFSPTTSVGNLPRKYSKHDLAHTLRTHP